MRPATLLWGHGASSRAAEEDTMRWLAIGLILAAGRWLGEAEAQSTSPAEPGLWTRKPVPAGAVTVVPSFFPGMSSPEFQVDFTNVSPEATDALNVFLQESIQLDGTVYPRLLVRWAGQIQLISPGGRWSHKLAIEDFLPFERGPGRRLPLAVGLHTIKVLVGSATSKELRFAWNPGD